MAQNAIARNRAQIESLGDKMWMGLVALGVTLGITQITAAAFKVLLEAFKSALGIYNSARGTRKTAAGLVRTNQKALKDWLMVVRGILVGDFGNDWSDDWASAGFVQPSTAVPTRLVDQIALAGKLGKFFTANPGMEVPDRNVTAVKAGELVDAVNEAEDPLLEARTALKAANTSLRTAQTGLVTKMSFLIKILSGTLSRDDARWERFGLNIPATQTTPAKPTGLQATVMGAQLLLECDAMPLATRYRFRRKIEGVDAKYNLVASSTTPMVTVDGVAAGLTSLYIVEAVNGPSQSVASDPITVVAPLAPEAKPANAKGEVTRRAAISPDVKSNGNGHGNGSQAVNRLG